MADREVIGGNISWHIQHEEYHVEIGRVEVLVEANMPEARPTGASNGS